MLSSSKKRIQETLNLLMHADSTNNQRERILPPPNKKKMLRVMCHVPCVTCHLSPTPTAINPAPANSPIMLFCFYLIMSFSCLCVCLSPPMGPGTTLSGDFRSKSLLLKLKN